MSEEIDYHSIPLGAKLSPPDERDWNISKLIPQILTSFPLEFELPYNHDVKNQGAVNSCVANSLAVCREITQQIQSGEYKKMSVGFAYGNRTEGVDWWGHGLYPRQALQHLKDEGICQFDLFPYDEEFPAIHDKLIKNKEILFENAYQHRISSYCRIYNLDEIKSSLTQLKSPVTFIMKITPCFYKISKENPIFTPPADGGINEPTYGYHELTCNSYKILNGQEVLEILNSYSSNWGNNGRFYIPVGLINTHYFPEWWSITDTILPIPPKPDPEPKSIYTLSLTSDKTTYKTLEPININISTNPPIANQKITAKFTRPNSTFSPTVTTDVNGCVVLPFIENVSGIFYGIATWIDPNNETQTASITLEIIKAEPKPVYTLTVTTDKSVYKPNESFNVYVNTSSVSKQTINVELIKPNNIVIPMKLVTNEIGVFYIPVSESIEGVLKINVSWIDLNNETQEKSVSCEIKKEEVKPEPNKEIFFRVVTGSFNTRELANKRIVELKEKGFDSFIAIYEK